MDAFFYLEEVIELLPVAIGADCKVDAFLSGMPNSHPKEVIPYG